MLSFLILSSSNPHVKKKISKATPHLNKKHRDQPIGHHQPPQPLWLFVKQQHVVEASNDPKTKAYCGEPEAKSITMGRCLEFSSWITSWKCCFFLIGWRALLPRKCGEMFDIFFQLKQQTIGRGGTFRTIFVYEYIYIYLRIAKTNQPWMDSWTFIPKMDRSTAWLSMVRSLDVCGWGGKLTGRHLHPKKIFKKETGKKKHDFLFKMNEWRNSNFFIQVRIQISYVYLYHQLWG